ncbi:DUF2442 domain-containing protein [Mucilaginibacter arboris]|uniref:DUF2442 domain-containing protein n=1 Tax=Mucilaginibacter arboris TaxID=2682090 RepID=A0A7K1T016_9SPHI|nr:DUF2442 domain-containing protein [Mucilaginibacter arboris]MVN22899.1 DUF2442 domain-containing protein [Mucilaginibacter arboris]
MSTSKINHPDKIINKKAKDPFDRLIFEQGLRAKQVLLADKKLDRLVVQLNNNMEVKIALSNYPKLKKASQAELDQWELIADGIGLRWDILDEDLSIKGIIKESALNEVLHQLQNSLITE